MHIPKTEGEFGLATAKYISLGQVQGKIILFVVARRLTEFVANNRYVDMFVQKVGL